MELVLLQDWKMKRLHPTLLWERLRSYGEMLNMRSVILQARPADNVHACCIERTIEMPANWYQDQTWNIFETENTGLHTGVEHMDSIKYERLLEVSNNNITEPSIELGESQIAYPA
jgi:hypothetical protein